MTHPQYSAQRGAGIPACSIGNLADVPGRKLALSVPLILAVTLLALPLLASAQFQASEAAFRKAVTIPPGAALVQIPLDRETLAGARPDLADLRVVRENEEQPYVLGESSARYETTAVPTTLLDRAYLPGAGVQAILDLAAHGHHNRLRLTTRETNFRSTVKIETSSDRHNWAVVRPDAEIFDFTTSDRHAANLWVNYPDSTRRYVRLTVAAWKDPEALAGATLDDCRAAPAIRTQLGSFTVSAIAEPDTKSMLYVLDLGQANLPAGRLDFEFGGGYFERAADIESSASPSGWHFLARSVLARLPGESTPAIEFTPSRERYLRVRIYHGDDKPVDVRRISVSCVERYLTIQPAVAGTYWLYYGRKDATAPRYDLAAILARTNPEPVVRATLDAQQANPAFKAAPEKARPWTERHPELLYTVLGVAVLGLGAVTLRLLRDGGKV